MKISAFAILSIMGTAAAATDKAVINIKCQDMDWEMLTFAEQNYAADAVERAFNHVSGTDHEMNRVQWVPASSANLLGLGHFDGQIVRPEGAVKDDNCWLCLDDDDSFKTMRGSSNSNMEAAFLERWAQELERNIQEGPYSSLSHAFDCDIAMVAELIPLSH
uniref:Uncharacterized protein n=1 Tax=Entomoneis paludosa TaxID=265537 RepID=A0A7S2YD28_9STRA|mmetsp:Transcript_28/g.67  ORF Transcript_28/g.67 Transcript_28/m.67 type:complete len:162 (+) Transcript_28:1292-1777(+)